MECLGRSHGQNPRGLRSLGFWPWDHPRHCNHNDTPSAFPNNVPSLLLKLKKLLSNKLPRRVDVSWRKVYLESPPLSQTTVLGQSPSRRARDTCEYTPEEKVWWGGGRLGFEMGPETVAAG